jgi:hypothetical protein
MTFAPKRWALLTGAGLTLLTIGGATGVALAASIRAQAPHTQASAYVNIDGTIARQRNIAEVTHPSMGIYCVRVSDPQIDIARTIPSVSLLWEKGQINAAQIFVTANPAQECGNRADTITVRGHDGQFPKNVPFTLAIP